MEIEDSMMKARTVHRSFLRKRKFGRR